MLCLLPGISSCVISTFPVHSMSFCCKSSLHFFFLALDVVNPSSCVNARNEIGHPACRERLMKFPVLSDDRIAIGSKTCVIVYNNSELDMHLIFVLILCFSNRHSWIRRGKKKREKKNEHQNEFDQLCINEMWILRSHALYWLFYCWLCFVQNCEQAISSCCSGVCVM